MRASTVVISVLTIGVMAACDSSTAPAKCDFQGTSASFSSAIAFTGVVTSIKSGSAASSEVVTVRVAGTPPFTMDFTVDNSTAVFERDGAAAPKAASACQLAVGRTIEIPFALIGSGFGDYIGESQAGTPPSTVSQIVIDR